MQNTLHHQRSNGSKKAKHSSSSTLQWLKKSKTLFIINAPMAQKKQNTLHHQRANGSKKAKHSRVY